MQVSPLTQSYWGSVLIYSGDDNVFRTEEEAADYLTKTPKISQVGDTIYISGTGHAPKGVEVVNVRVLANGNVEYTCTDDDILERIKNTGAVSCEDEATAKGYSQVRYRNTDDNVFQTLELAEACAKKVEILKDEDKISREPIYVPHIPVFSVGDTVFDVRSQYVREGRVLKVRMFPKQNGCLYYCADKQDETDKYCLKSDRTIFTTYEGAEAGLAAYGNPHKYFRIDELLYYGVPSGDARAYRVVDTKKKSATLVAHFVRSLENGFSSSFYSDNQFIHATKEKARDLLEIRFHGLPEALLRRASAGLPCRS